MICLVGGRGEDYNSERKEGEGRMKNEGVLGSHPSCCHRSDPWREKQSLHLVVMPGMSGGGGGQELRCDPELGVGRGGERRGSEGKRGEGEFL